MKKKMKKKFVILILAMVIVPLITYAAVEGELLPIISNYVENDGADDLNDEPWYRELGFNSRDDFIVVETDIASLPPIGIIFDSCDIIWRTCDAPQNCRYENCFHPAETINDLIFETFDNPKFGYLVIESEMHGRTYFYAYEDFAIAVEALVIAMEEMGDAVFTIGIPVDEVVETIVFDCLDELEKFMASYDWQFHDMCCSEKMEGSRLTFCSRPCAPNPPSVGVPWVERSISMWYLTNIGEIAHPRPCRVLISSSLCTRHTYTIRVHCGRSCGVFNTATESGTGCGTHHIAVYNQPCICG